MESQESGSTVNQGNRSVDYMKWMIKPFGIFLAFFIGVIAFSHCAFPKIDDDKYESDRKELSKIYEDIHSNYELKYILSFDSLKIAADKSLKTEQKKRKLDSISKRMRAVDSGLLAKRLEIDTLMDNADKRVTANMQKQVEHLEIINGWWVSIVAGVATIIALCLAIQQNAGYQELKDDIKAKLSEMDTKMAEIGQKKSEIDTKMAQKVSEIDTKIAHKMSEITTDMTKKMSEVDTKMSEIDKKVTKKTAVLDEYIGKQKLLKSLQLLESISALCHYNNRTEDKLDLFSHVKLLLVRANDRFEEFDHLTHAEASKNLTDNYRIPLVMVIQQMEGILRQLQSRFSGPKSIKFAVQSITKLKSSRKVLNSDNTFTERELKDIIMSLKGVMGSLSDILSEEIPD